MDQQDAFRNMLSGPKSEAGPSRTHQKGNFGGVAPKRGWGLKQTKEHKTPLVPEAAAEKKDPGMAPRHVQKKHAGEGQYKDRAAMRRSGKDDEYKDVEEMLAEFEKRKAEAEDAETVEKTRQYLGGDATHSILVKGLDYSLLAQRKAELEREREIDRDEELDAMMGNIAPNAGPSSDSKSKRNQEPEVEKLGKGFKSIGSRKDDPSGDAEGKKKKKKKKAVVKEAAPSSSVRKGVENVVKPAEPITNSEFEVEPVKPIAPLKKVAMPIPQPDEFEEDIFGDAGEYDLKANIPSEDSDDDDDDDDQPEILKKASAPHGQERGRSRSRSRSRSRGEVPERRRESRYDSYSYSRSRSRSISRSRSRDRRYRRDSRSHSRDRYDSRRGSPPRPVYQRSRSNDRQRYRSRSRTPPRRGYRSPSRSRSRSPPRRQYRSRSRSPYADKRRRYQSPSRLPPPRRRSPSPYSRRQPYRSSSRSPPRQSRPSPSPPTRPNRPQSPPVPSRTDRRTRSPSPYMFTGPPLSPSPSGSRSPSPVMQGGKLQPLQSSTISDLSGFLAAESASSKAEERKNNKAQWRARQGLGIQEGVDPEVLKKKEMNDKQKSNREYVLLMNKMKKDEAGAGGSSGGNEKKEKE